MTADELVEAVARAICCPEGCITDDAVKSPPPCASCGCSAHIAEARAAIRAVHEAMRGPSAEMHKACQATTGAIITRRHCKEMWQGMLAAHPISEVARDV